MKFVEVPRVVDAPTPDMVVTEDDARRALKDIQLINAPFMIKLQIGPCYEGRIAIEVAAYVKDRDYGRENRVTFRFPIILPVSTLQFYDLAEACVKEVFIHEFRECFHIKGYRVHDPHANNGFDLSTSWLAYQQGHPSRYTNAEMDKYLPTPGFNPDHLQRPMVDIWLPFNKMRR